MRLFLDANVLFTAAHNPAGRSAALFELARAGLCELVTSPHALEEASRNLRLKYPGAAGGLDRLASLAAIVPEGGARELAWARDQGLPEKDAPILAAAAQATCDILVTGDRTHFGHLFRRRMRGVEVLMPAQALARLLE